MRIRDYLEWQDSTDLDAFITRLTDSPERVRQSIRQYVVSPRLRERLDLLLGSVGERLGDNRDVGRYIYGNFGSGKSNLLTVLGKMLERDEVVYDEGHSALRELRGKHAWLDRQRTLVVRINMMAKHSLVRALYEGYNGALPAGVPRIVFTDEERVFDLIDRDAQRMGGLATLLEQAATDAAFQDISDMPRGMPGPLFVDYYHRLRRGDADKRIALAAALMNWRNHGQDPIRPDDLWVDAKQGLDRIARHAKEHGYTAIAWLIDELVIWIRGKSRHEYVTQINHLSALVDHDAARVLPFFVAVAVQMDIARTCPQDMSDKDFQEQLGFIRDRFQPQLDLEDQDLYEVAADRVLKRKTGLPPAERKAFESAIDATFSQEADAIGRLSGGLAPDLVRRLYPFNPALLRILVDVTQALSRNRTAIAALYRLLNQYADLSVGQFIPVGALWDFVFEPANVDHLRSMTGSMLCQRMSDTFDTYQRVEGKLEAVAKDAGAERIELDQLFRTALLCPLSELPYFPDGRSLRERVTASMLLHLNRTDVKAMAERTGISKVVRLFRKLSAVAPANVQVGSDAVDPPIHIKTQNLDIDKILTTARAEIDHPKRFAYMRRLLMEQLGLKLGTTNDGTVEVLWRGTRRRGRVRLDNVRKLSYAGQTNDFEVGKDEFLILVDYPFDEEIGRTRQDDRDTCERAKSRSTHWTVAWLPEHLSPSEMDALNNAVAVDLIRKDERRFLEDFSPRDAAQAKTVLEHHEASRKQELGEAIRRLYFEQGIVFGMKKTLENVNATALDRSRPLELLGAAVLDSRYPSHPRFPRRVTVPDLTQVAQWVIEAAKRGTTVDLRSAEMALVDAIVEPLEMAHKAPSGITRRSDGRYLTAIQDWIGQRRQFEAFDLRVALMAEVDTSSRPPTPNWGFGLTREVANFFLLYLLQVAGFEAQQNDRSMTLQNLADLPERFRLVKEEVVDAPTWDNARHVAEKLLEVRGRAELPSPPEQVKLCREAATMAKQVLDRLKDFEDRLRAVCAWAHVPPDESARLRTASELSRLLEAFMAELVNAARVRRLAEIHGAQLSAFVTLRSALVEEVEALRTIEGGKLAFQHVQRKGSPDDRSAVLARLQNLLRDPQTAALLHDRARAWNDEAQRRFAALLDKPSGDDDDEKRRIEAERKAAEERAAREQAERLAAEAEAQRVAANKAREEAERAAAEAQRALEEARRKADETPRKQGARRARAATLKAVPRAQALARAQAELSSLIDATPGASLTIHITVEPAE